MTVFARNLVVILVTAGALLGQAPSAADDLYERATVSMRAEDWRQGEFLFKEMRAAFPLDTRWGTGLFAALTEQSKWAEALKVARESPMPKSEPAAFRHQRIALMLMRLERWTEALTEIRTALQLSESKDLSGFLYGMMGDVYSYTGELDRAMGAYRQGKALTGRASFSLAFALGVQGHSDEEIAEYRALIRESGGQAAPVVLNNLAYALAERGESLNEALALSRRAVGAQPGSAVMDDTLGWVYFKLGMLADAEETLVKALVEEEGNQVTLRLHFAAVMDAEGRWTPERRELRGLLEKGAKAGEIARMKELLRVVK